MKEIHLGTRIILTIMAVFVQFHYAKTEEEVVSTNRLERNAGERKVLMLNGVEYALRWCPAGTFIMGSPDGEPERFGNELQHSITLSKGFWMLETEVTQEVWENVMGNNPSAFKGNKRSVEQVSWEDCQGFITKLNEFSASYIPDSKFYLPSEAQWEYACRAGTEGAYAGDLNEMGWYRDNSGLETKDVGQKKPNAWGLYDMHGNVFEWCSDWYDSGYYSQSPAVDPEGPSTAADRVNRGGSHSNVPNLSRSAYRGGIDPLKSFNNLGLRLCFEEPVDQRKVLTINGVEYAFRWCPPVTFMMGNQETQGQNRDKQRLVTLSKGFWMLETEVTQEMWASVMGNNPSHFIGDVRLPVEQVSWEDCRMYIEKLTTVSAVPGFKFGLPSESQWEYACRAGTTEAYGGTGNLNEMGWYGENSGEKTHVVGQKQPNAWGFYDMHGNVWEWCSDWYDVITEGSVTDPIGPPIGTKRVNRGGSYVDGPGSCRSVDRYRDNPMDIQQTLGLRLILTDE
ncbi:MAG: formylglycine-generating enzyme family protein [Thermoguttaceae bacterium]